MEEFPRYKKVKKPKANLLPVPNYCKKCDAEDQNPESALRRLHVSDPSKILDLCESLTEDNTLELERKINKYLIGELEAENVFIITLVECTESAVIQVIGDQILDGIIRLPITDTVIAEIARKKTSKVMKIDNMDKNIKEHFTKKQLKSEVILVPVLNKSTGCPIYLSVLVGVVAPVKPEHIVTQLVQETFRYCLAILRNTSTSEEESRIKKQCQSLLKVARKLFSHLGDVDNLLNEIMSEARKLTSAERCSLFLLDPDHLHLVAKVFDGMSAENANTIVKIAKDQGIAGHVAATGKLLNIKDAYKHPLFYKGVDEATGFRTRNILCFPIRDEDGIVGVAQLCNKERGDFTVLDEEVALAFSIYCGLSIMHSLVYKKIKEAQIRNKLSNELMLYHMKISTTDVLAVVTCRNRHDFEHFNDFSFSPRSVDYKETPCLVLKMFENLGLIEEFGIAKDVLTRFILYVQKGYRETPYHNWLHAFSVVHFAYLCVKNFRLIEDEYLTKLEAMAYLTSCICHDIDHRGTTNSFQLKSGTVLANLYSSEGSVMERHHLSQTLCILNTENCNFLEILPNDRYQRCLDMIRDLILATDLANHLDLFEKQKEMSTNYNRYDSEQKQNFLNLLMTIADLSDQTKEWSIVKEVAQRVYDEFFIQGDMEKSMGQTPIKMMDRDKASIPDTQIDFLYAVVLPLFTLLQEIFPQAKILVDNIKSNIMYWEACKPIFEQKCKEGSTSLQVLLSEDLDQNIQDLIAARAEETESEADEGW